jgi:hypothetical protein
VKFDNFAPMEALTSEESFGMPRFMLERTFPQGLVIPANAARCAISSSTRTVRTT